MITKRNLGRGKARVTFSMPPLDQVELLSLVGDFNNWSITETPMQRAADGSWSAAVTLATGRDYEFRYLADGQTWHNDWQADRYAPNEFGSDNSVVSLKADPVTKPARKAASKKKL
jgi:1,4-alpha-glucan branching enzyme